MKQKLSLEQFAYRFRLESGADDWLSEALGQLGEAIGARGEPNGELDINGPGTSKPVDVGLEVRAVRKAMMGSYPASVLAVSAAAFDPKGKLVGWTTDLDEDFPRKVTAMFYDESADAFFVVDDRKHAAEIQAGPAGKSKPAGRTPSSDAATKRSVMKHGGAVLGLTFTADGSRIVSIGVDGVARIFDVRARCELAALRLGKVVQAVAAAPRGSLAAAATTKITFFSTETGKKVADARGHGSTQRTMGLAFTDEGRVVSAGASSVVTWDASTGAQQQLWKAPKREAMRGIAVSPDLDRVAVLTNGSLHVLDAADLRVVASVAMTSRPRVSLAWTRAGIAASCADGGIVVLDPTSLEEKRRIDGEFDLYFVPAASPDAVIALDGPTRIESVSLVSGARSGVAAGKLKSCLFLASSPDGDWIAAAVGPRIELVPVSAGR